MRIFAFLLLATLSFSEFFLFNDSLIYETQVWDGWEVPNGAKLIFVDADSWSIEGGAKDWWDVIKRSKLEKIDDLPSQDYSLVSTNPFVLKSSEKCYTKLQSVWFEFVCEEPSGKILRMDGKADAYVLVRGSWSAVYHLEDDDLSFFAKVSTNVPIKGELYLINGSYERKKFVPVLRAAKSAPEFSGIAPVKVEERMVIRVGEAEIGKGESAVRVFEGRIREKEESYYAKFVVSSSSGWVKPRYSVSFENTRENGLGFPMPDGIVHVFSEGIPVGEFDLEGAPVGGKIRILENEVEDLRVRVRVLSSMKKEGKVLRKLRIEYENYGEERKLELKITGRGMKFEGGDIAPSEEADDYLVFSFEASGKGSFNVSVESDW